MARGNEKNTPTNCIESTNPTDRLNARDFKKILTESFGITGRSPAERAEQLKSMSPEDIADLWQEMNRLLQGSDVPLVSNERTMKIGNTLTIPIEYRHNVFVNLINDIKKSPPEVNPARIADTMALGLVLLHPFLDGNGRTARLIGLIFRNSFDNPETYEDVFSTVTEPRDIVRQRGGFVFSGYIPRFTEGFDQSDPEQVSDYLSSLLKSDEDPYLSPYGTSPLYGS